MFIFRVEVLLCVLICQAWSNKITQTGWLKQHVFAVSGFWSLKVQDQGVGRVHSSENSENVFPTPLQLLVICCKSLVFPGFRCITFISAFIFTQHSPCVPVSVHISCFYNKSVILSWKPTLLQIM